jgi:hypothetical protein
MNIIPVSPEKNEPREERQALTAEEWNLLETTQVTEEDKSKLPQQLLLDPPKEITPQDRDHFTQSIVKMNIPQKIRLALVGNQEARNLLIHDPNKVIALAVMRNPRLSEDEVMMYPIPSPPSPCPSSSWTTSTTGICRTSRGARTSPTFSPGPPPGSFSNGRDRNELPWPGHRRKHQSEERDAEKECGRLLPASRPGVEG